MMLLKMEDAVGGAMRQRSAAQGAIGAGVEVLPGIGETHFQLDAAHADAHQRADLEPLEPDGIDLSLSPLRALQGQPPERFEQRLSQRRQVEPELIAFHLFGRQAIGEQVHLLFDAVLHLAARAVELLVQVLRGPLAGRE